MGKIDAAFAHWTIIAIAWFGVFCRNHDESLRLLMRNGSSITVQRQTLCFCKRTGSEEGEDWNRQQWDGQSVLGYTRNYPHWTFRKKGQTIMDTIIRHYLFMKQSINVHIWPPSKCYNIKKLHWCPPLLCQLRKLSS